MQKYDKNLSVVVNSITVQFESRQVNTERLSDIIYRR